MNCTEQGCTLPVILRVFWPGKVPPPVYCIDHGVKAVQVLNAIGIVVATEAIPSDAS